MFNRVTIKGLAALAAVSALVGCVRDEIRGPGEVIANTHPSITLQLHTGLPTRATTGHLEEEQAINSIDVFFYKSDATEENRAVYAWHGNKNSVRWDNTTAEKGTLSVTIPLEFVEDEAGVQNNRLFNAEGTCKAYTVVNSSVTTTMENPTITELRNVKQETKFFSEKPTFDPAEGLVMFSSNTSGDIISYDSANKLASGDLYVKVLAAKVDLFVQFAENVQGKDPSNVGTPEADTPYSWTVMRANDDGPAASVYMVNGLRAVRLSGWTNDGDKKFVDWNKNLFYDPDARVNDYFDTRPTVGDETDDLARKLVLSYEPDKESYPYVIAAPFYSYPNKWEISPLELHRTTLLLKVYWVREDGLTPTGEELVTYYTVPLNLENNVLEENTYYRVKVRINTLGGLNYGEPVELEPSIEILDWGEAELEAKVRDMLWLDVEQKVLDYDGETYYEAIMNNVETITIPFNSSHKIKVTSVKIEYQDFQNSGDKNGNAIDDTDQNTEYKTPGLTRSDKIDDIGAFMLTSEQLQSGNYQGVYIDQINKMITLHHAVGVTELSGGRYVVNTSRDNVKYKFVPYVITLKLAHDVADARVNPVTIYIKHYPGVYIDGEINQSINYTGYKGALGQHDPAYDAYNRLSQTKMFGFVRVNSNANSHSGITGNPFGGLRGIAKAGRRNIGSDNPVMYIVSAVKLDEDQPYHIADPRHNNSDLDLRGSDALQDVERGVGNTTWITSRHIDGGNSSLQHYYPTNESMADEDAWAISPRFRIASSFGTVDSKVSREDARKRCASYQEYGYPAGRWRLPTLGEMHFIYYLSDKGLVPPLFGGKILFWEIEGPYWCAQGSYDFNTKGEPELNGSNAYVRCVYDDWYWVKKDANDDIVPDKLKTMAEMYNGGNNIFIWGDREKNNPQVQPDPESETQP